MNVSGYSVCNLDLIYNKDFEYSLPRNLLEKFLSGIGFVNKPEEIEKSRYSEEEGIKLRADINALFKKIMLESHAHEGKSGNYYSRSTWGRENSEIASGYV